MNVLLTGGAGFIGSHAAAMLAEAGHYVVIVDNLSNSDASVLRRLERVCGHPLPFVEGDIRDSALMRSTMKQHGVQSVMHFAGLKAVGESNEKPLDYYSNNVQGTISLLQAMDQCDVRQLVFSSSATVYGQPQYLPLDEAHPTSATNPYGRTKLHIEEMLRDVAASSAQWRFVCLRYFNPVGAHSSGLLGEAPRGTPNNLMPYVAQVAVGTRAHLNVWGDDYDTPDGTGVRDYIHVMDLVEGHLAALNFLQDNAGWSAINLGTGTGYSVLDMVKAFEQASQRAVPYSIKPRRQGDVASCYANPQLALNKLGWRATRSLQDMCDSAWAWQSNVGK
ncbi:UDP-glucose 4-epimerase GalE [Brachymonas denitrificans]|uniref:UDP-glucose 4-epimerase GalE n=1 Tax=Brachymonas denitrificans TaxID=28220 RepID=UPI001BCE1BEF|nr:UDP-glucose 4-epimerase GalE [Brachymonas denitrificans]